MPRFRQRARVIDGVFRRELRRHGDAGHVLGSERLGGDDRGQRGVDAAGEAEHDVGEAALADVVAHAEDQRVPDLRLIGVSESGSIGPVRSDRTRRCRGRMRSRVRERALGIERTAPAVEHQVVVAAELIDVDDAHFVAARHAAEHLLAKMVFSGGERRRREVQDRLCAGRREFLDRIVVVAAPLPEVAIVPDVLADADAEPSSSDLKNLRAVKRLEIPVFVEDVVSRQQ